SANGRLSRARSHVVERLKHSPIRACAKALQCKGRQFDHPRSKRRAIVTTGHTRRSPSPIVTHQSITSPAQLATFCGELAQAYRIGMDTEFVSEDTFRPELCLVQVATKDLLAVIDPYRAGDLS